MGGSGVVNAAESANDAPEIMPDLRIVPTDMLVPHEEHDDQRSGPLIKRIAESGVWLNPPIVAPMGDGRFVILDGANRHYCLRALGYPYILVQVVEYESQAVQLETWHHVVSGLSWFEFLRAIRELPELRIERTDLLSARVALARRLVLAYAVLRDDSAYTLNAETHSLEDRTAILRQIVDTYKTKGALNRINTDALSMARRVYPNAVAIVVFPRYQPVEILVAARDGVRLPPGISRHLIQGRAMRLNYPLAELQDDGRSLEEKNARLQAWIQQRTAEKRVRYYAEATYLFDE